MTLAMRESPQANTFTTVTAHFPKSMTAALTPGSGVSCGATATVQKHDGLVCFERLKADGVDIVAEGPWTRWKAQQRSQSGIDLRERVDYGRRAVALATATDDGPVLVLGRRANQGVHDIETVVDGTPGVALAFEAEPTNLMGPNAATGIVAALAAVEAGAYGLVVIARGGGRPTDLSPFHDARVARAIQECSTAVAVALGHASDHTLADDAAAFSFNTPTDLGNRLRQAASPTRTRPTEIPAKRVLLESDLQRSNSELAQARRRISELEHQREADRDYRERQLTQSFYNAARLGVQQRLRKLQNARIAGWACLALLLSAAAAIHHLAYPRLPAPAAPRPSTQTVLSAAAAAALLVTIGCWWHRRRFAPYPPANTAPLNEFVELAGIRTAWDRRAMTRKDRQGVAAPDHSKQPPKPCVATETPLRHQKSALCRRSAPGWSLQRLDP